MSSITYDCYIDKRWAFEIISHESIHFQSNDKPILHL